ncbi:MAG: glycosyltransferase [Methanobrevibacter ruminantium]|uniref:glycosyltransferase family 2 protein n=1 Tax=Methanobrevibacter ruminantium TaxID=83816 RepID=UPI002D80BEC6|nr:glycosyltransferase [Methanobrevibacter ruminantium]MCI5737765.1 glycosyltransferase [Methanobrevibacter ruminantium]
MVKVSVVIPVYNVERYLEECLDSVINQTLEDIEIICINDGSTDNSLEILEDYVKKDNRIRIIDQENLGISTTRNNGLKVCRGKYVCFLDSDDYLELNTLRETYDISEKYSLDMCFFKLINFDENTKEQSTEEYFDMGFLKELVGDNVFNHHDIGENLYRISVTVHSKLFNRDLISDIKFPEGLIFEDNAFFTEAMFKSERVFFLDKYLYNRRLRADSITHTNNEAFIDWIEIYNLLIKITKDNGFYDDYKKVLYYKAISNSYVKFSEIEEKHKDAFFQKLKEDYIQKQAEWKNDDVFKDLSKDLILIFDAAIISKNHMEFEYRVNMRRLQLSKKENFLLSIKNLTNNIF